MPINPVAAVAAGIIAGVIATGAQLVLWWVFTDALPSIFYRDARLTAAMLMGPDVLPPPATFEWRVMLVATFIHFMLSIAYGLILAPLISRPGMVASMLAGAVFGLIIYATNMYGMTLIFPWFSVARDWITLATHIVFGISLAVPYKLLSRPHSA
ncbi:hypothetical protein C8R21_10343 [Nitrosospira multiformis]|jgi:hypothetical protein|uniref:Sodium:proline symporter n=1 Tax=Nitrosospira multiformis TaxID=1231 RepID=A0A2T5IG03_9PROT|nr:sodium:proline symporter [Nitrosospira multiformis]PTQ82764.1 hypothetical protein C8R21_10343 [Nitrosospira multiformis]